MASVNFKIVQLFFYQYFETGLWSQQYQVIQSEFGLYFLGKKRLASALYKIKFMVCEWKRHFYPIKCPKCLDLDSIYKLMQMTWPLLLCLFVFFYLFRRFSYVYKVNFLKSSSVFHLTFQTAFTISWLG